MLSRLGKVSLGTDTTGLLPELPVPQGGGPCGLIRVSAQVAEYLGYRGAFAELMAVSGAAFDLHWFCPLTGLRPAGAGYERLAVALPALGFPEARVLASAEGLPPAEISDAVKRESNQGRPVILGGWQPEPEGLALLAGVEPGGLLCGYVESSRAEEAYLAAPPASQLVVVLGERKPPDEGLFRLACTAARECWEQAPPGCGAVYRTLLHLLTTGFPAEAPFAATLAALVEARTEAQEFLLAQTECLLPLPAAWTQRAADLYEQMLDLLEPLTVQLSGPERDILWAQEDWRQATAELLGEVAELDAQAVNCLRRAPEAEFAPEEET